MQAASARHWNVAGTLALKDGEAGGAASTCESEAWPPSVLHARRPSVCTDAVQSRQATKIRLGLIGCA